MTTDLRPATERDKAFLITLQRDAYREVVRAQFGVWDDEYQAANFERKWLSSDYQIVEQDGHRIGALAVSREPDHLRLREIQLLSSHRNRGIGTALILRLTEEATAAGLPLRLRVLTANRAKALYERIGFQVTGMHADTHYWMERAP